jgi:hypothetical protein
VGESTSAGSMRRLLITKIAVFFLGYFFAYEASCSKRSRNSRRLRLAHACQVATTDEAAGDGTNSGVGVHDF